jgi:hypothetical protein
VNHEVHTLDVDASRGDVGGDEDGRLTPAAAAPFLNLSRYFKRARCCMLPWRPSTGSRSVLRMARSLRRRGDGVDEDDDQAGFLREDVVQKRVALVLCR